jgi:hypothetical protein
MVAGGKSPSAFSLALPKEKAWQKERLVELNPLRG